MRAPDPLRVGLIGLGTGAQQLLPALTGGSPYAQLVGVADVRAEAREQAERMGVKAYPSVEQLVSVAAVEAVWVATPNHLHADNAIEAARARKHVIVSKPLAISLQETTAMNAAAADNGVMLLAGHTQSLAPTIRRMAAIVASGELGRLGMLHTWHFTDWMYRPRQPVELDPSQGGGPVFRQASHQVDILRSIAGSPVLSVRASVVQLDEARGPAPGAYTAYLQFGGGVPATVVYSGYGHFRMDELIKREARQASNSLGLFGLTLVTCEHGDLRESPDGLVQYRRGERTEMNVPDEQRGAAELEELYHAVREGVPLTHDGAWGQATLEVCLAIQESAREGAEVRLAAQI